MRPAWKTFQSCLYRKVHHIDAEKEEMQPDDIRKISRFEDSREFEEFETRMNDMRITGISDPYFVPHDSVLKDTSLCGGKEVINLASYNYIGMSGHPRTAEAAKAAIDQYGTSASGSRIIAGEKTLYQQLERAIADWKHTEGAVVLVGGHSTNVTFVGNFCNERDLILYDALSHNSILQGCQLSRSDTKAFPHNDFEALEHMLRAARDKYEKILVIVEGVYSMDGDIAPIPDFGSAKKQIRRVFDGRRSAFELRDRRETAVESMTISICVPAMWTSKWARSAKGSVHAAAISPAERA